ncbi:MAG: M20 family metallopeptidase [Candidatus Woesebacteria bacterium]
MLTTQQLKTQLGTLVGFQTLTGNVSENAKALDYVESLLSPQAKVKRIKNKTTEILLASTNDSLTPEIGYMVHMDVVSASPALFSLKEKNGKLYGRGVSDMKFSIPLGVSILNELIETHSPISFTLAITTDEEVGGYDGGAYLAETIGWKPKALIVPDGGDNMQFVNKAKGVCQLIVTASGRSAHASRPWEGKNALVPIAKLITELEKRYGGNNQTEGWKTTLNFGKLIGGISINQVCDKAVLNMDFRYPETDSVQRITDEVSQLVKAIEPTMKITKGLTGLPTYTDVNLPVVKRFLNCIGDKVGKPIIVAPTYGASDARHFAKDNIPVLMIKPMGGDIHCETEWLDIQSTLDLYQGLRTFLQLSKEKVMI